MTERGVVLGRLAVVGAVGVVAVGALVGAAVLRPGAASGSGGPATVDLVIHYSHFSLANLTVDRGETVRFVVHNTDPIDHELIVGDRAVQDSHEQGADIDHDGSIPGQISVPAETTVATTVVFTPSFIGAGGLQFACHLPGHYAYGMHGGIAVVA
jgi:uncharacterized cupredoxin-like copper-binding protein